MEDWSGQWIAGFTSVGRDSWDRHYLIYLMWVSHAFDSHADLWNWLERNADAWSKAADRNQFGDVYRLREGHHDVVDWRDYYPPIDGHPHSQPEQWHRDILDQTAVAKLHRVPALLVGDEESSFLWDAPKLYLPGKLARTKRIRIAELLDELREVQS